MKNKLVFIVIASALLLSAKPSQAQLQTSLRSVFILTTCAAVVSAYVGGVVLEEVRYKEYQRPHLISPTTPVAELRSLFISQIGTAMATHGHFLSFEDAVAIAVDRQKRDAVALRTGHPDWPGFIEQIETAGFRVQTTESGKLQIAYPKYPSRRHELFVEALITIQLSNMLHGDPPGERAVSVQDLFLYSDPRNSDAAPMNVVKIVR